MPGKRLAGALKRLREARGLTQVEVAEKAKLTQSYYAELEGGQKTNPSLAVLKCLGKSLRVPVTELLE